MDTLSLVCSPKAEDCLVDEAQRTRGSASPRNLVSKPTQNLRQVQFLLTSGTTSAIADGMDLGQKLQFYRRIRRMSLRDVAEKADCSPSFLSQIELDRVSPTIKRLGKICRALGVTPADFLREESLIDQQLRQCIWVRSRFAWLYRLRTARGALLFPDLGSQLFLL